MPDARLIARTHEAEVFAWGAGRVLKLYRPGIASGVVTREAENARGAHAAGIPTPAVIELCAVDGRDGIVFERVEGPTMLEALVARPETAAALGRTLADLQADLHRRPAPGVPILHARLAERVRRATGLAASERDAALAALDALPAGDVLCHGDLHPANVMITAGGPVIIDWRDVTRGAAPADLARSALIMRHAVPPDGMPAAILEAIARFREPVLTAWLARYAERVPDALLRLDAWTLPVAAARLSEPMGGAEHAAIRQLIARRIRHEVARDVP